jgi:hypothetical protein
MVRGGVAVPSLVGTSPSPYDAAATNGVLSARRTSLERRFPKAIATLLRITWSGAHCLRA